jgi:putative SOS response-associated peptidase YedK
MPAVVAEDDRDRWLDPATSDRSTLEEVLAPSPDGLLALHPVDRRVNDARQKGRELTIPVSLESLPDRSGSQEVLW